MTVKTHYFLTYLPTPPAKAVGSKLYVLDVSSRYNDGEELIAFRKTLTEAMGFDTKDNPNGFSVVKKTKKRGKVIGKYVWG